MRISSGVCSSAQYDQRDGSASASYTPMASTTSASAYLPLKRRSLRGLVRVRVRVRVRARARVRVRARVRARARARARVRVKVSRPQPNEEVRGREDVPIPGDEAPRARAEHLPGLEDRVRVRVRVRVPEP